MGTSAVVLAHMLSPVLGYVRERHRKNNLCSQRASILFLPVYMEFYKTDYKNRVICFEHGKEGS